MARSVQEEIHNWRAKLIEDGRFPIYKMKSWFGPRSVFGVLHFDNWTFVGTQREAQRIQRGLSEKANA